MTSETDLSTADLAQTGGTRPQDRADDEQSRTGRADDAAAGTGDRTYETAGNRVAQDADAVGMSPVAEGSGSTREDAIRGDMPEPGRARGDMPEPGRAETAGTDRDMSDRDMTDRGMGGTAGRDMGDRDTGGQGMAERDMGDRGMGDRGMGDRGMGDRGMGDRAGADDGRDVALLDQADAEGFRQRWSDTQARFVDDPREAVQTADALVAELMQTLASSFSQHKGELESHWRSGGDPDTEDLRQALQRYRSFFDRLLSA